MDWGARRPQLSRKTDAIQLRCNHCTLLFILLLQSSPNSTHAARSLRWGTGRPLPKTATKTNLLSGLGRDHPLLQNRWKTIVSCCMGIKTGRATSPGIHLVRGNPLRHQADWNTLFVGDSGQAAKWRGRSIGIGTPLGYPIQITRFTRMD